MTDPHRSLAQPLAWIYWLLIIYASLHPFRGWSVPPMAWSELLHLPQTHSSFFDKLINIVGYLPLGFLATAALLREQWRRSSACLLALGWGSLTSYTMEVTQNFLPTRVPSQLDWMNNTLGTLCGVTLALGLDALGALELFKRLRQRWFLPHSAYGLVLLILWPLGLLFPPTVPWVQGQFVPRVLTFLQTALADTPAQPWLPETLWREDFVSDISPSAASMLLLMALGLLAPIAVAYCICRRGWPRLAILLPCMVLCVATTALSTSLNFGPDHAWAWWTPAVLPALVTAGLVGLVWAWLPQRVVAATALIGLTCLTTWVNTIRDSSPFYALSLANWEQGAFIRFFGLAQWVGWLWPYLALAWLLARLAGRDTSRP